MTTLVAALFFKNHNSIMISFSSLRILGLPALSAAFSLLSLSSLLALDGPTPVRTFGPTGLEISLQKNNTLKVTAVQKDSPAAGKFTQGQIITTINGQAMPAGFWEHRLLLGDLITKAEATDGKLIFATDKGNVTLHLPILGSYSDSWPLDCPKTQKIIDANAAYLRGLADSGKLGKHSMTHALAIVSLLSTGEEKDLEAVRKVYRERMKTFNPNKNIGPHTWHNGHQGIAAGEYYLRTGDKSVLPLINAICKAAKRYQVQGGYYHWATQANPKYGVVNACGTNMLTAMLLAKQCGAKVDQDTLLESLVFFYRFAGHGQNAYGNGRPELGQGGNGKTEQIAAAMHIAAHAKNGDAYAMAAKKCAQQPLYTYRSMFRGHTGPIGNLWFSPMVATIIQAKPDLYHNRQNQVRWFYELSRQHDGSFVMSSCRGYDNTQYGNSMLLGLTGPRKTLQITGAPNSRFATSFSLPANPWGRPADLAFLEPNGSPNYKPLDPAPHLEAEKISTATQAQLQQVAGHPEHSFREIVAASIRKQGHYDLIESLLASKHPFERHTACLAINHFQPWRMRYSKGWRSERSIDPEHFTQTMFDRLIAMINNPDEALWLVDQSMLALAAAKPEQTLSQIQLLLPWLNHQEWWLKESAFIAVSPALETQLGVDQIMPPLSQMLGTLEHAKPRSVVYYLINRNIALIPKNSRHSVSEALKRTYAAIPKQTWEAGSMDLSNIPSVDLANTIQTILNIDPLQAPAMAILSAKRLDDLQPRERGLHIDALINAAQNLDPSSRKQVGDVLTQHYRSSIYQENAKVLSPDYKGSYKAQITPLNKILDIDDLCGISGGWTLLDENSKKGSSWEFTTYEPAEKRDPSDKNRRREVSLPEHLKGWFQPDYDAKAKGWKTFTADVSKQAPRRYRNQPAWRSDHPDQAGELIFIRKTFELKDTDYTLMRLAAYTRQGYQIYINGELIVDQKGRSKNWFPRMSYDAPGSKLFKALKPGTNVIAATSFLQYFKGKEGDIEVYLEGLKELPKAN
ncbi:MAG: hypothetical protein KJO21_02360 [Verrucomicrobiae bacterium]|nr:hypothetical protein [Verrucomicrobiae bacterium]NNJ44143.1 hypothetical protein [Akkermansiaceae bacterium]